MHVCVKNRTLQLIVKMLPMDFWSRSQWQCATLDTPLVFIIPIFILFNLVSRQLNHRAGAFNCILSKWVSLWFVHPYTAFHGYHINHKYKLIETAAKALWRWWTNYKVHRNTHFNHRSKRLHSLGIDTLWSDHERSSRVICLWRLGQDMKNKSTWTIK